MIWETGEGETCRIVLGLQGLIRDVQLQGTLFVIGELAGDEGVVGVALADGRVQGDGHHGL